MEMTEEHFNRMPADVQEYLRITFVVNKFLDVLTYCSPVIQVMFLILFIYQSLIKKSPHFSSAYFYILILEYTVNAFISIVHLVDFKTPLKVNFFTFTMLEWYLYRFYAFCNTMLMLNRFTGVFLFKYHQQIWRGYPFIAIYTLIIIYPFILSGYTLGSIGYCFEEKTRRECGEIFGSSVKLPVIALGSNILNAGLAFTLGAATALARRIRGSSWQIKHKYETYLLVQSIITSAILIFYEALNIINVTIDHRPPPGDFDFGWNVRMFLLICGVGVMKQIFHVSSIILLFIISKYVRDSFLAFYYLDQLMFWRRHDNRLRHLPTMSHFINSHTSQLHHHHRLTRVSHSPKRDPD